MLEVIDLMAYLRSSVGIFISLNNWYHSKYDILGYARNLNKLGADQIYKATLILKIIINYYISLVIF